MPPKPANPGNARVNADNNTALMIAAKENNFARVQEILAALPGHKAPKLDLANKYGWRAIHFAAQNGSLEILNALVAAGADINITTKKTSTPLAIAIYYEKLPIVQRLIELRADVNIGGPKSTPLGLAFGLLKLHDNNRKLLWDVVIALLRANIDVKGFDYVVDGSDVRGAIYYSILRTVEPGPNPDMPAKALELLTLFIEKYPSDIAIYVNQKKSIWTTFDIRYITDIFAEKLSVPLMRLLLDNGMKIVSPSDAYGGKQPDAQNPILKAHADRYSPEMNAFLKERFPNRIQKLPLDTLPYPDRDLKDHIDKHYEYINQLSETQQYTLAQYSFHGDVMLNAMLRGTDTIETYRSNIVGPIDAIDVTRRYQLTCLFLYQLAPQLAENNYLKLALPGIRRRFYYHLNLGVQPGEKFYDRWNIPADKQNFRKDIAIQALINHKKTILDTYRDSVYPQLKAHLDARDLAYFRRLTYDAFKIIYNTIRPIDAFLGLTAESPIRTVYRGVKHLYIPTNPNRRIIMNSFTSTSIKKGTAITFYKPGGGIYKFHLMHNVPGLYMESLTYIPNEYELLLLPGVNFIFISNGIEDGKTVQEFLVTAGKPDETLGNTVPETYEEYNEWRRGLDWNHAPPVLAGHPVFVPALGANENIPAVVAPNVIQPNVAPAGAPAIAPAGANINNDNLYAGGGRKSRHKKGSRKTRRIRGGRALVAGPRYFNQSRLVQMKRNNQTKKLNSQSNFMNSNPSTVTMPDMSPNTHSNPAVPTNNKQNTGTMSNLPTNTYRLPGDRWDTSVPIPYIEKELTKEDRRLIERMKASILRSE